MGENGTAGVFLVVVLVIVLIFSEGLETKTTTMIRTKKLLETKKQMDKICTTRRKMLDTMCQMASIVSERGDWEETDLSSAIGVRSRGVLIVGGEFSGVFEKGAVLCRKGVSQKTETKRVALTQVKWQAGSYGDDAPKKKMLTRAACETGWSSVNWWKTERKIRVKKTCRQRGSRIDVSVASALRCGF